MTLFIISLLLMVFGLAGVLIGVEIWMTRRARRAFEQMCREAMAEKPKRHLRSVVNNTVKRIRRTARPGA